MNRRDFIKSGYLITGGAFISSCTPFHDFWAGKLYPNQVKGLSLWLRADKGVVLSGSAVTQWQDQSGNGNHASPGVVAPTLVSNGLNRLPVINFTGTASEGFIIPDHASYKSSTIHLFIVCRSTAIMRTIIGYPQASGAHIADWFRWSFYHAVTNEIDLRIDVEQVVTAPNANWANHSIYSYSNGSGRVVHVNGQYFNYSLGRSITYTGADLRIGMNGAGAENMVGDIAEIVLYNRALSERQRIGVELYLSEKYAIPLSA